MLKNNILITLSNNCKNILQIKFNTCEDIINILNICKNINITVLENNEESLFFYNTIQSKYKNKLEISIKDNAKYDGLYMNGDSNDMLSCFRYLADETLVFIDDDILYNTCLQSMLFTKFEGNTRILKFKRPGITICSLAYGDKYRKILAPCIESKLIYCEKNKYNWIDETRLLDHIRSPSWSKIKLLDDLMTNNNYDDHIYVWLDADTIIMNDLHRIEEFLLLMPQNAFMLIGRDFNDINAGIFFIRHNKQAHNFLKLIYDQEQFINDPWWEQRAIIYLYETGQAQGLHVVDESIGYLFNGYHPIPKVNYPYTSGNWLIHFAGYRGNELINLINKYNYLRNNINDKSIWNSLSKILYNTKMILILQPTKVCNKKIKLIIYFISFFLLILFIIIYYKKLKTYLN